MAKDVVKSNKPQLRGLLQNQIKKNLALAVGMCFVAAVAQKIWINDERKKVYAEFYKNYDIEKAFNTIRNKGLFDSCQPDK
ncbi:cytochrome c oxidase subunit 6C-like [Aethina tumida]|uniref:cytochrome c oxidase subunit 6C n=1 Tax=Aethina tumida TaxID=116153 RepID=UPI00096B2807|nr:cytochrome c oxidase subunit 6C [Aethina tumida]XP_049817017.1 cytochrome c oxidase subunit 6C-like [Aethina tumida]